jgi:hypothetical protein
MRILALAAILLASGTASAVCPGHSPAITATTLGTLRVCPNDTDVDGQVVPATGYYESCTVTAVWIGGGTGTSVVNTPTPGTPYVVGFPAARGSGGATATCRTTTGQVSAVASSSVTFRTGGPAAPGLSAVINPPVP